MYSRLLLNILFCYSFIALPLFMDALIAYISAEQIFNNSTGQVCVRAVLIKSDRKGESHVRKTLHDNYTSFCIVISV